MLCLGADQPIGSARKLSRKFVLQPPHHLWVDERPPTAMKYAAAYNLDHGARIVAAYGSAIVLFSVPIDAFLYSTAKQEETLISLREPAEELETANILLDPATNTSAVLETLPDGESGLIIHKLNMSWVQWARASDEHEPDHSSHPIWPFRVQGKKLRMRVWQDYG